MTLRKVLTSGFICLASTASSFGQSDRPGVVRIADRPLPGAGPTIRQGMNSANPATVQSTGFHGHSHGVGAGSCPQCQGGGCPNCQHGGSGGSACHVCQGRGCQYCTGLLGCLQEHTCKLPPDYGFSVPGKYPIERRGVQYFRYFPANWYGGQMPGIGGQPQVYPQVYQPTDTTQAGFYYQHVPAWSPVYSPLPERPRPEQWHNFAPAVHPTQMWRGNGYGSGSQSPNGYCPTSYESTPLSTPSPATPIPSVEPAPVPSTTIPPRPVQDSARDLHIRRASY